MLRKCKIIDGDDDGVCEVAREQEDESQYVTLLWYHMYVVKCPNCQDYDDACEDEQNQFDHAVMAHIASIVEVNPHTISSIQVEIYCRLVDDKVDRHGCDVAHQEIANSLDLDLSSALPFVARLVQAKKEKLKLDFTEDTRLDELDI